MFLGYLRKIRHWVVRLAEFFSLSEGKKARLYVNNSVITMVKEKKLTYLSKRALSDLAELVISNERRGIEGAIIEAGCALGGSAVVIANSKTAERQFLIYDVFETIPRPSSKDGKDAHKRYEIIRSGASKGIDGEIYYGYTDDLYARVESALGDFGLHPNSNNIKLIKGLFEDTMEIDFPVSLAHIDCDWYESVTTCLERIWPYLVQGGTMVIDDYYTWSGCSRAVDEYFGSKDKSKYQFKKKYRLHITKK